MIRSRWLIGLFVLGLAACATPATPPSTPTQAPPRVHPPYPETATAAASALSLSSPGSCATTNAAPPDKFRADDPAKLAANTGKPKLIEFFAYW